MSDITQYTKIQERLQALKEPDREVDAMINIMIHQLPEIENWTNLDIHCLSANSPVTKSLDAAIELCEKMLPEWNWSISSAGYTDVYKNISQANYKAAMTRTRAHPTPAIALLIARFKALEELE